MHKRQDLKMLSVLYAEDDAELRMMTVKTLQLLVDNVYAVSCGIDALDIFESYSVNVVILDIHMGMMSGIDVAKTIRQSNNKVPIIIISGSVATEDLLAACTLNLIEYIRKPIDYTTLMNVLYSALDRLKESGLLIAKINNLFSYDFSCKALINNKMEKTNLTHNEIKVLELLLSRRGEIIHYEIFSNLFDECMTDNALKNLVLRLRKKMGTDISIRNLSKIGYTLI